MPGPGLLHIEVMQRYRDLVGERWPVRPEPLAGELLSSWLTRLARANGLPPNDLGVLLGVGGKLWAARFDLAPRPGVIDFLATMTGVDAEVIYGTTLVAEARAFRRLLLPLRLAAPATGSSWLQFCPECLAGDDQPYFRKIWRFASTAVCWRHRCRLADRCPRCSMPIGSFRHGALSGPTDCVECGQELRATKTLKCSLRAATMSRRFSELLSFEHAAGLGDCADIIALLDGLPRRQRSRFGKPPRRLPLARLTVTERVRCFETAWSNELWEQIQASADPRVGFWRRHILARDTLDETLGELAGALAGRYRANPDPDATALEDDVTGTFGRGELVPRQRTVIRLGLSEVLKAYSGGGRSR
jgi:hypothetical protein